MYESQLSKGLKLNQLQAEIIGRNIRELSSFFSLISTPNRTKAEIQKEREEIKETDLKNERNPPTLSQQKEVILQWLEVEASSLDIDIEHLKILIRSAERDIGDKEKKLDGIAWIINYLKNH